MSKFNKSQAPYYDYYEEKPISERIPEESRKSEKEKGYTHMLAVPGRVAQAREITQLQSMLKDIVKGVGDSILKDGDIIEGCQVIPSDDKKTINVDKGKVYVNGMVLPVPYTEKLSIVDSEGNPGKYYVILELKEELVTEALDNSLLDPAVGYDNAHQSGCHRVKSSIVVRAIESSKYESIDIKDHIILNTLLNGEEYIENYTPEYDKLTTTLARRTNDESGSYIVNGLNTRVEAIPGNEKEYNIVVEAGKAYVQGFEIGISHARRIANSYENTPLNNDLEFTFANNTASYLLSTKGSVSEITKVTGSKLKSEGSFTSERATLTEGRVDSIKYVYSTTEPSNKDYAGIPSSFVKGDNTYYTYKVGISDQSTGVACYLDNTSTQQDSLVWKTNENITRPNEYYVDYYYEYEFDEGDYKLSEDNKYIEWIKEGDSFLDAPADGHKFRVYYNIHRARKDIVCLDSLGNIHVVQGNPKEEGYETSPDAKLNTLTLAIINNPPNGSVEGNRKITASNIGLTRFTMNDIQKILDRVNTIAYDQSILSLEMETVNDDRVSNKKGVWTEPFIDLSRIHRGYNKSADGEVIDMNKSFYDLALNLDSQIAYLPVNTKAAKLTLKETQSSVSPKKYKNILTIGTTGVENFLLVQDKATEKFAVNPYEKFPEVPEISLTPPDDYWYDDTYITVNTQPITTTQILEGTSTREIDNRTQYTGWLATQYRDAERTYTRTDTVDTTTTNTSSTDIVREVPITHMRQSIIEIEATNFAPDLKDVKCYFDDKLITTLENLEGETFTYVQSDGETIHTDSTGKIKARFTIPKGILTGTRELRLKSSTERPNYYSEGSTTFVAEGIARTIQTTNSTVTTIFKQQVKITEKYNKYVDPIGQTFVLDKDSMIKGIDIYFAHKPTNTNTPIECEIREVENGTISLNRLAHTSLPASSVNVAETEELNNGSIATRFNFDDPILLEKDKEYAFVLRSSSTEYSVWVATLGEEDKITHNNVLKNPLMKGVMMSSSNNSTWTAHQSTDMKFRIVEDVYSEKAEIEFEEVDLGEFYASRLYMTAGYSIPAGTNIDWEYKVGDNWVPLTPMNILLLRGLYNKVSIRAILSRESSTLSPAISLSSLNLVASCHSIKGSYISKTVEDIDYYTSASVIIEEYLPSDNKISVKVSNDDGASWIETPTSTNSRALSEGWTEKEYKFSIPNEEGRSNYTFKLAIDLSSLEGVKDTGYAYNTPVIRRVRAIFS